MLFISAFVFVYCLFFVCRYSFRCYHYLANKDVIVSSWPTQQSILFYYFLVIYHYSINQSINQSWIYIAHTRKASNRPQHCLKRTTLDALSSVYVAAVWSNDCSKPIPSPNQTRQKLRSCLMPLH